MALRGFGFILDLKTGLTRHWVTDKAGIKRWLDNGKPVATPLTTE